MQALQRFYRANKEFIHKMLFLIIFFTLIYIFINFLFWYVAPFVFGYAFSLILSPLVALFHDKFRIPRIIGTAFVLIVVVLLLSILGTQIVTKIINESKSLVSNIPDYVAYTSELGEKLKSQYNNILSFIPGELSNIVETSLAALMTAFTSTVGTGVRDSSMNVITSVPSFLMATMLCVISTFFFTKDRHLIHKTFRDMAPLWLSESYRSIKKGLTSAIGGYFKAQLILMAFTATICVVGLSIIRFPYALLLGLSASLIDALPVFGVGFVLWPLTIISLISGSYTMAIGIMITYVVVVLTRQILEPKILGSQIGLHPLLTLMSIYIGLKIFGILGFLIGPMVLVVSRVILNMEPGKLTAPEQN